MPLIDLNPYMYVPISRCLLVHVLCMSNIEKFGKKNQSTSACGLSFEKDDAF